MTLVLFFGLTGPAHAGDVRGTVVVSEARKPGGVRVVQKPAAHDSLSPIVVFLRGEGMVTSRRGGPLVQTIRLTAKGPEPPLAIARLGDTLRVMNETPQAVDCFRFQGSSTSVNHLPSGATMTRPLGAFGPIEISMSGVREPAYVLVLENPFHANTSSDGRFLLDGVTPGTYEVCAWQPGRSVSCVAAEVPFEGEIATRIVLR